MPSSAANAVMLRALKEGASASQIFRTPAALKTHAIFFPSCEAITEEGNGADNKFSMVTCANADTKIVMQKDAAKKYFLTVVCLRG